MNSHGSLPRGAAESVGPATPGRSRPRLSPSPEQVRESLRIKTPPLMVARLRSSLYLVSVSLLFFTVQDLLFVRTRIAYLLPIKIVQFSLIAVVLKLLRTQWAMRHSIAIGLCAAAVFGLLATLAGVVRGNDSGSPLLFLVAAIAVAVGFPWGAAAQVVVVGIFSALLALSQYALGHGVFEASANPTTAAALSGFVASIFVARKVAGYRWEIEGRELDLQLREERFRALIEDGGDLILVTDVSGLVHYASPSVGRLLGVDLAAGAGMSLFDVADPQDASHLRGVMTETQSPGAAVQRFEVRLRVADGSWRVLEGMLANLLANPAVGGLVFNARDVTELRRSESLARRNQTELTHVLRLGTIGEIASALAHEINQPLGAISNYAAAGNRFLESGKPSEAELRQVLHEIGSEAQRAARIIRSVRDLSRKGDAGMEMVEVDSVIRHAVELVEPQARAHGVSLRVQSTTRLPRVHADPIQIEQVVLNLMLNAIEAMQASSERILTVRTSVSNGKVLVCVGDTGPGLDAAIGEQVFEPFFTTKPKGLGMGLAISRRIVEAHGGQLSAASKPEGGSEFSLSLPVAG